MRASRVSCAVSDHRELCNILSSIHFVLRNPGRCESVPLMACLLIDVRSTCRREAYPGFRMYDLKRHGSGRAWQDMDQSDRKGEISCP